MQLSSKINQYPIIKQKQILSQKARLALRILQLPLLELEGYFQQEMLENPLLERVDVDRDMIKERKDENIELLNDGETGYSEKEYYTQDNPADLEAEKKRKYRESLIAKPETLQDHLLWQLGMFVDDEEYNIGEYIVGNLSDNGYLKINIAAAAKKFGVPELRIKQVLSLIQTFDPPGVAARDLRECLLIQLHLCGKQQTLSCKIVELCMDYLQKKEYTAIARKLKAGLEEVKKACLYILSLEPKPGRAYSTRRTNETVPDIVLRKEKKKYSIEINNEYLPALRINKLYINLLKNKKTDAETKRYIKQKQKRALWLVSAIKQRQNTLRKVAEFIVSFQKDFLEEGPAGIRPFKLKDVASALSMSKSTISRTVANKYIQTDYGMMPLKQFFASGLKGAKGKAVSSLFIKDRIKELIQAEDNRKPLSDKKIADTLKPEGINVARRTVAKYRENTKILPAHLRKKVY